MPARRPGGKDTIPDILLVLALAGCGSAPPSARPPAPAVAQPIVRAAWGVAFERGCRGSLTPPVVSPDQKYLGLCDAVFAYDGGRYLGRLPAGAVAFVAGDGVLSESFRGEGVELEPIAGTTRTVARTLGRGRASTTTMSPDRTLALAVLEEHGRHAVVLLALPALARQSSAPVAGEAQIGFFADGTPIVLAGHVVSRLEADRLVPIAGAPRDLDAIAVAAGGTRAIVTRGNGARAIVELPSWREVVALPAPGDNEIRPEEGVALAERGDRVAFVTGASLVIAEIAHDRLVELHRRPFDQPEGLAFSRDGRSLFAKSGRSMLALREGLTARAAAVPVYRPALPKHFTLVFERGGTGDRGDGIARYDDGEELLEADAFAYYRNDDDYVTVTVYAHDPAELAAPGDTLDTWAERVVARYGERTLAARKTKRWITTSGRALEYATFVRDGCDPHDRYTHVEERDGIVYRVEVTVPPGLRRKHVLPRLHAFFDAAFSAPKQRELAVAPAPPRGGC